MNDRGWIKLHRQLQECPIWYGEKFSKGQAWVDLLLLANHRDKKIMFNGEMTTIKRGQYLTSTVKLAEKWKWSRPTVVKFLNMIERDKMIVRSSDNTKTIITIENYGIYQDFSEDDLQPNLQPTLQPNLQVVLQPDLQPTLQQSCNPLYTNNNDKNDNNDKNINNNMSSLEQIKFVVEYLNEVCGTKYRYTTKSTQRHIQARLNDGYTFDDFKTVIDKKSKEWKGTEHERYLSPDTLFGTKFEKYINQKIVSGKKPSNSFNSFSDQRQYDFESLEKELFSN